ncbi:helix-turn-helix domain-containing protein, partial [Enterococcus gallinarum]
MAKYPFELKLKIVKEYLSDVGGYRYLANKYGISSKSQVSNWVNVYREYGEEGLLRKHQNQK